MGSRPNYSRSDAGVLRIAAAAATLRLLMASWERSGSVAAGHGLTGFVFCLTIKLSFCPIIPTVAPPTAKIPIPRWIRFGGATANSVGKLRIDALFGVTLKLPSEQIVEKTPRLCDGDDSSRNRPCRKSSLDEPDLYVTFTSISAHISLPSIGFQIYFQDRPANAHCRDWCLDFVISGVLDAGSKPVCALGEVNYHSTSSLVPVVYKLVKPDFGSGSNAEPGLVKKHQVCDRSVAAPNQLVRTNSAS